MAKRTLPAQEPGQQIPVPEGYTRVLLVSDGCYKEVTLFNPEITLSMQKEDICRVWIDMGDMKTVCVDYSLQPQSLWRIKQDLRKAGLIDDVPENEEYVIEDKNLIKRLTGATVNAVFVTDAFGNNPRSKLANPGFVSDEEAEGMSVPVTESQQAAF